MLASQQYILSNLVNPASGDKSDTNVCWISNCLRFVNPLTGDISDTGLWSNSK